MGGLRVVYLHDNLLDDPTYLSDFSHAPSIAVLTMYNNPLALTPHYRFVFDALAQVPTPHGGPMVLLLNLKGIELSTCFGAWSRLIATWLLMKKLLRYVVFGVVWYDVMC
jgi:hypothetical protein